MKKIMMVAMSLIVACSVSFAQDAKEIMKDAKNWRDEQLPRLLSYEDLMKWLARNQTRDENMVVRREVITIRK